MKEHLSVRLFRFCLSSLSILREVATQLYIEHQDEVDELIETMEQEEAEQNQAHTTQRQEFRKHYLKRRQSVKAHASPLQAHNHSSNLSVNTTSSTTATVPIVQSFLDIAQNINKAATNSYVYIDTPQTPVEANGITLEIPFGEALSTTAIIDEKIKYSEGNLKAKLKEWFVSNASHDVKHEDEFFTIEWKREEDSDNTIQFNPVSSEDTNSSATSGTIRLATFDKLIERLVFTRDRESDVYKDVKDIIFATYTSCVTVDVFLEKLGSIFILFAKDDTSSEESKFVTNSVLELIEYWLTHFFYDFNNDTTCRIIKLATCIEEMFPDDAEKQKHVYEIRKLLYVKLFETTNPRVPSSYPLAVSWEQRIALESAPKLAAKVQEAATEEQQDEEETDTAEEEEQKDNSTGETTKTTDYASDSRQHEETPAEQTNEDATNEDENDAVNEEEEEEQLEEEEREEEALDEEDKEPMYPDDWDPEYCNNTNTPMELLAWPTRELARQITLIEQDLFRSIQPSELLNNNYVMKHMDTRAPNVANIIHRFNNLSKWVARQILECTDIEKRADTIMFFIDLLEELVHVGNYNSVMAIYGALTQIPIHRLKLTWEIVSGDHSDILDMFTQLLSPTKKFKNLKDAIDQSQPPAIPYLGVFLGDLSASDSVSQDTINNLINVNKKRVCTKVIRMVQSFQNYTYSFKSVPYLQHYFKTELYKNVWSDDHEYQVSLQLEPKKVAKQQQ